MEETSRGDCCFIFSESCLFPGWMVLFCIETLSWDGCWECRETNKSNWGVSLHWYIYWNTFGQSLYSDGSLQLRDCQFASAFNWLGKYSAVTMIWYSKRYFQISLLKLTNVFFPISSTFLKVWKGSGNVHLKVDWL